jgi:release factor glutamine methyltransferase
VRTLAEVVRLSTDYLRERGLATPRLDAELLVGHALGLTRIDLYVHHDRPLSEPELATCRALLARRAQREPVAYILGEWGFRGLRLAVDRRVLVPRPETEVLAGRAIELAAGFPRPRVLDVGTGSGALAIAIAAECPGAVVTAGDLSPAALELAGANADRAGVRLELVVSDLLAAFAGRRFDLIVANLPYIPAAQLGSLEPEVAEWEPQMATVGGAVGDELVQALAAGAAGALAAGGWIAMECGPGQPVAVADTLSAAGFLDVRRFSDLAGVERFVEGRSP